jgi:hypothetical protein
VPPIAWNALSSMRPTARFVMVTSEMGAIVFA